MRLKTKSTNLLGLGSDLKWRTRVVLMASIITQGTEVVWVMMTTIFVMQKGCKYWRKRVSGGAMSSMFYGEGITDNGFHKSKPCRSAAKVRPVISALPKNANFLGLTPRPSFLGAWIGSSSGIRWAP
jgi:hypothetical protein